MRIIIDAGHGGSARAGNSSAYGSRGPSGLLEKDVTLDIARHVVARLGGDAALTRMGDSNLPLGARAAHASRTGADVFVSIHANSGPPEMAGPETWVHPDAGADSYVLAGGIQRALERLAGRYGGSAEGRRGPMAVLSPAVIGRRTAACLVEVDYLSNPQGERRLGDPGDRAAIGAAIAGAIREHLGEARHGRTRAEAASTPAAAAVAAFGQGGDAWLRVPSVGVATTAAQKTDLMGLSDAIAFADADFTISGVTTENWRASGVEQFGGSRIGTPMRELRDITGIVLHETDGLTWAPPPAPNSVHMHIERNGTVRQHNQFWHRCFHAGVYNGSTIGIEHVNTPYIADPNHAPADREGEVVPIRWGRQAWLSLPPVVQMEGCHQMVVWLLGRFSSITASWPQLLPGNGLFPGNSADATERWFLVNTMGHDYFAAAGIAMLGIVSHSGLIGHEDGAALALYTALRNQGLSSPNAVTAMFTIFGDPARYRAVTSHGIRLHLVRVTDFL